MGLLLWWLSPNIEQWFTWNWHKRALYLTFLLAASIVSYLMCLRVIGVRLKHFRSTPSLS